VRSFYAFYDNLPKRNNQLLPMPRETFRIIANGPLRFADADFVQEPMVLLKVILAFACFLPLVFGKRMYWGFDYLFVTHRVEPIVLPALRRGRAIDKDAFADALMPQTGDLDASTPVFRSQNQAARARAVRGKLEVDAQVAEAMERRERARAALKDAEREAEEAERRAKDRRHERR
jgi:hypothetical protein